MKRNVTFILAVFLIITMFSISPLCQAPADTQETKVLSEQNMYAWAGENIDKAYDELFWKRLEDKNEQISHGMDLEWTILFFSPPDRFFQRECALKMTKLRGKETVHIVEMLADVTSVFEQLAIMHRANPSASINDLLPLLKVLWHECDSDQPHCAKYQKMFKRFLRTKISPIPPTEMYLDPPIYEVKIITLESTVHYSISGYQGDNMGQLCKWLEDIRALILKGYC